MKASSRVGPVPAQWWVELGLGPLVGRAVSMDVSRGGYGLRKPLGSLTADGWDCVPAQLVAWPEASQHWCLQVVGWGSVFSAFLPAFVVCVLFEESHSDRCEVISHCF